MTKLYEEGTSMTTESASPLNGQAPTTGVQPDTPHSHTLSGKPLPAGYREGVITAITVFIGFSLAFLRYWAFEAPGDWTVRSLVALVVMLIPIFAQINALYRALRIEDDDQATYNVTIKWFLWSVLGMLFAVCVAGVVISGGPNQSGRANAEAHCPAID
jgi:hypothetical protein